MKWLAFLKQPPSSHSNEQDSSSLACEEGPDSPYFFCYLDCPCIVLTDLFQTRK